MNLKTFIDRPILSIVISVVITLIGGLAVTSLPVEQYPDIAPPTISVWTNYPGANAETVQKAVIVPLEEAINGVENMTYITSTASNNGDAEIMIYFKQGTNADMAAVNVQNSVSTAMALLPAEVVQIGVTTSKQQNAELKTVGLYDPTNTYDMKFLDNYFKINIEPRLKRIYGVGKVMHFGANYAMRIWMDPAKMAQYKLIPSDITAVLARQNIEAATGSFGENHDNVYQYTMKYRGRFSTPEEFENLVVRSLANGNILRLKDVATVELGAESYNFFSQINGKPSTMFSIYQTAGTNASEIIGEIDATLSEISESLPKGLEFVSLSDTNRFLKASIKEVIITLFVSILLVVLVVYLFLQDLRSTFIPTISIFVSIIGTFAFMTVAGFSINLLTLFALVLAIGTVVDNAIIVVEAVQSRFEAGYRSPYAATCDAMGGISSAIIISTLIFMAVFIPVSMMGGTSGTFYAQFGLTMAAAVGLSAINALTLSPALCAWMLTSFVDENGNERKNFAAKFRKAYNVGFNALLKRYKSGVMFFIKRPKMAWAILACGLALLIVLMRVTPTGFVPQEDMAMAFVSMNTKPGTSTIENEKVMKRVSAEMAKFPEVDYVGSVGGYSFSGSGPSMSLHFLTLSDWDKRKGKGHAADDVIAKIYEVISEIPDAEAFAMAPPMIPGYGMGNGFELYLQDRMAGDIDEFKAVNDQFVAALNARPEIDMAYSAFDTRFPQYWVDIDAAVCERAGVSTVEVLETLSGYYGGGYVSNFNRFSKLYRVMTQAAPEDRVTAESLNKFYVRTAAGEMTPLSHFVKLNKTYGPQSLNRFNLYNAISISGTPASGYSSGEALKAVAEVAAEVMPRNYSYEFGGISREEAASGSNVIMIFVLCIVLVYLILSAMYESLVLPFTIILSVPCGLMGSFLFAQMFGLENNIYLQTGLIMLIGLLAKTAILITDFAGERRRSGMSIKQAAIGAATHRLRPILMTALTMVFGMLPLMFASGVGANGNSALGTGAIGGMLVGTLVLLFLVPALWMFFQGVQERIKPITFKEADPAITGEIEEVALIKHLKEMEEK